MDKVLYRKLTIKHNESHNKPGGGELSTLEGLAVPTPLVAPVMLLFVTKLMLSHIIKEERKQTFT